MLEAPEIVPAKTAKHVTVTQRVDSPIEVESLKHGGILPYVLRELMAA